MKAISLGHFEKLEDNVIVLKAPLIFSGKFSPHMFVRS